MFDTAVLFLIFNRPDTTALVLEKIKQVRPKYLFVAADGPRQSKPGEAEVCKRTREIVTSAIDWPCELKTLFGGENLGCRKAVSQSIDWFFSHVEEGIILEDDCLPDISFFPFCAELLEKYRHNDRIISVGGTNMNYQMPGNYSYGFSRYMNMWGWATWKRSLKLVDYDLLAWKQIRNKDLFLYRHSSNSFGLDINFIRYWKRYFTMTANGEINTWDYQWIFAQMYHNKLSLFPAVNLVKNIGFTHEATHTKYPEHPIASFSVGSLLFPLKHPQALVFDEVYEENHLKKIWFGNKKESVLEIVKTRLLYVPFIQTLNRILKKYKPV